ncbi:MAG: tRNA methyl transferase PRC-barrel domain-containing protein, partial [Gaiellaceae bacterium]
QSYMLASLRPASLTRLWFPLGATLKRENRARAAALGLSAARAPESQEACFLGGADYRDFLERHGVRSKAGPIVDGRGRELGRHEGTWRYTTGQRKGLGLGGSREPMFVVKADAGTGVVEVGGREALACKSVRCDPGMLHTRDVHGEAKLRFRSPAVGAAVHACGTGFTLELDEPVEAVAPGQLAAIYVDDAIIGAGTITTATRD